MSKITFILENKFSDELTDEEFARLVEITYDLQNSNIVKYFKEIMNIINIGKEHICGENDDN